MTEMQRVEAAQTDPEDPRKAFPRSDTAAAPVGSRSERVVIRITDLVMSYGGAEPVLAGASLKVREGEFVSLVGPSGSGKSTVLRAIAGLHAPAGGTVERFVSLEDMGFLFQDDALLPWRTAQDNVALGLRLRGKSRAEARAEADQWLSQLGLAHFGLRYPRQLSGGQRKRVALAQVLALRPKLLLMDEPFASLDAIVRHRVTQELLEWVEREKITVLLVTHDLEEAQALSDTIYLLSRGPRALIRSRYEVRIARPRDLIHVRGHPSFAPLLQRIWDDLWDEVDVDGGGA
ncbi:ABC transporter ATP-binding protein [Paracoccus stylophorae]|nr:ABC transporter ATP-binding protein [Paracoccus stylophorae]